MRVSLQRSAPQRGGRTDCARLDIRAPKRRRECGFALLIVLWVLVLTGFLVAQITGAGRTELLIARNLYDNATAEAAVEGAVSEAAFRLSEPRPEQAWQPDGREREMLIGRSRVTVRIDNEAAHINPNFASPGLLAGLLLATGSDEATAKRLSLAIADWVGQPALGRTSESTAAEYRASGLGYTPPRAPMESLDELEQVRGVTPQVLAALRPHLTIYGPPVPDPQAADPAVAAALAYVEGRGAGSLATATIAARRGGFVTARITATANGPGNAELSRVAVVRVNPAMAPSVRLLAWGASLD